MSEYLLKCHKCGAVMVREGYHLYGWYLDGKKVEGCPSEPEPVRTIREKWSRIQGSAEERNTLPPPKP